MSDMKKDIENVAEGFWNKHKYCVIGGAVLLLAGLVLGLAF